MFLSIKRGRIKSWLLVQSAKLEDGTEGRWKLGDGVGFWVKFWVALLPTLSRENAAFFVCSRDCSVNHAVSQIDPY